MTEGEKLAHVRLVPGEISQAGFEVDGERIEAELMTPEEGFEPTVDEIPAIQKVMDAEGNETSRLLGLQRRLEEDQPTIIRIYKNHEDFIKGAGAAAAVIGGLVAARSLWVKRTSFK